MSSKIKTVLISGVSKGIGANCAKHLLNLGHTVIGIGRNDNNALKEFPNYHFFQCDLLEPEATKNIAKEIASTFQVDMFIHNAMYSPKHKPFLRCQEDDFLKAHTISSIAPTLIIQKIISGMRKNKFGRILFFGTIIQVVGSKGQLPYLTAKSALSGLTKGLCLELATSGVTCNLLLLGPVDTQKLRENLSEDQIKKIKESMPTGNLVEVDHIAKMVEYFLLDESAVINGATIPLGNASHLRNYS
ncbi:MAG: SDR family oxidoreductase [Bacteriovoracaceae bacterium]|nr:SDR family oxidoreductase [Bacteriovoracaceae bacterium]